MPVTTKRTKVKLPFITFQVVTGWEVKPLTAAQKKKRKDDRAKAKEQRAKDRLEQAKVAQVHVEQHAKAQAKRSAAKPVTQSSVGAAVLPPKGRTAPAKKATRAGQLCGQPTKSGGTCKRVVTNVPCPEHPAGRPKGSK